MRHISVSAILSLLSGNILVFPSHGFVLPSSSTIGTRTRNLNKVPTIIFSGGHNEKENTGSHDSDEETDADAQLSALGSKRQMLKFAIPALGIFLANPLLSNIDNAFVGKTVGTAGLAALSPATICTDQMLYLFSFLSRATTGIVSRAYSSKDTLEENLEAAREAASTPLTIAMFSGILLSIFYALFTPKLLAGLRVDPVLRPASASYVYFRGSIAWAALVQSVCLSVLLATRDAITPLKIISLAAVLNVFGDAFFCVYPFKWGCAGAAAATSLATLFSSGKMLIDLKKRKLLPQFSLPKLADLKELLQYVGPLFIITISRLIGFISMQKRAMSFQNTQQLAAYQICTNTLIFFLLFGEPLSQLHQTKLPALLDSQDRNSTKTLIKSVVTLAAYTSLGIGAATFLALKFGAGLFTSDAVVQSIVSNTAPAVSFAVMQTIIGTTFDGAMLASRDFSFIIKFGVTTMLLQLLLLSKCTNLSAIYCSFAFRLVTYTMAVLFRIYSGRGTLAKVLGLQKGKGDEISN